MCGRFVMARAIGDLVAASGAVPPEEELVLRQSWNVAPTTDVAIVLERAVEDEEAVRREIHVARWGLVPPWAKELAVGSRAFNARSETVTQKPTFRAAVRARRCAIPVEGYYEWLKPEPGEKGPDGKAAKKRPFYVHPQGAGDGEGELIFFAGLYEWWKDPEVAEGEPGQWVLSCTILTGPSPEEDVEDETLQELHDLHDRLPLPMGPEMMAAWLAPGKLGSAEEAQALVDQLLAQAEEVAAGWELREVGPAVGNVRNNGPELIEPVEGVQESLL